MKNNLENFISKVFRKGELKEISVNSFKYEVKNKISVLVPAKYVDKLASAMSKAGAGKIGNYELCSFRLKGTGTFRPSSKAKPFTGSKNKINFVEEVKLEMRCPPDSSDKVIDAIYKFHPYEEPVYEVTEIKFRSKNPESILIKLNKSIAADNLFGKVNKKIISLPVTKNKKKISTLLITNNFQLNYTKSDAVVFVDKFIKLKFN